MTEVKVNDLQMFDVFEYQDRTFLFTDTYCVEDQSYACYEIGSLEEDGTYSAPEFDKDVLVIKLGKATINLPR